MARLSNALVQGLINPSYQGMLGKAVRGGFQEIGDAYDTRRTRQATESAQAMLTGGDASDPRVQQSVQAVFAQMHQDPKVAQEMIDKARQQKRADEDQAMQKESFQQQKAFNDYRMTKAKEADAAEKAAGLAVARYNSNPDKVDVFIEALPPEQQTAAREAVTKTIQYQATRNAAMDEANARKPFSSDVLDEIKATPGMEEAVAAYEKMKDERPGMAEKNLLKQWDVAMQASIRSDARTTKIDNTALRRNQRYVEDILGPKHAELADGNQARQDDFAAMYPAVAKKLTELEAADPEFVPTPQIVRKVYEYMIEEVVRQEAGAAGGGATTPQESRAPHPTGRTASDGKGNTLREYSDGSWR